MWKQILFVVFTFCLGMGCGFTPVPEPPTVDPLDPLDLSKVLVFDSSMLPIPEEGISIEGAAGSAVPGSIVVIVDLDTTLPAWQEQVGDDGSFFVETTANIGDELRIQLRDGDRRSVPLDAFLRGDFEVFLEPVEREACLDVPLELIFDETAIDASINRVLTLRNDCSDDVIVESGGTRRPSPNFDLVTSLPITIPSGGSVEIDVSFSPQAQEELEAILLLQVTAPFVERRPVTLMGRGIN
jgi:hypothetical protein